MITKEKLIKSGYFSEKDLESYSEDFDFLENRKELRNIVSMKEFSDFEKSFRTHVFSLVDLKSRHESNTGFQFVYEDPEGLRGAHRETNCHPYLMHKTASLFYSYVFKIQFEQHVYKKTLNIISEQSDSEKTYGDLCSSTSKATWINKKRISNSYFSSDFYLKIKEKLSDLDEKSLRFSVIAYQKITYDIYERVLKIKDDFFPALDREGGVAILDFARELSPSHYIEFRPLSEVFGDRYPDLKDAVKGKSFRYLQSLGEELCKTFENPFFNISDSDKGFLIEGIREGCIFKDIKQILDRNILKKRVETSRLAREVLPKKSVDYINSDNFIILESSDEFKIEEGHLTDALKLSHQAGCFFKYSNPIVINYLSKTKTFLASIKLKRSDFTATITKKPDGSYCASVEYKNKSDLKSIKEREVESCLRSPKKDNQLYVLSKDANKKKSFSSNSAYGLIQIITKNIKNKSFLRAANLSLKTIDDLADKGICKPSQLRKFGSSGGILDILSSSSSPYQKSFFTKKNGFSLFQVFLAKMSMSGFLFLDNEAITGFVKNCIANNPLKDTEAQIAEFLKISCLVDRTGGFSQVISTVCPLQIILMRTLEKSAGLENIDEYPLKKQFEKCFLNEFNYEVKRIKAMKQSEEMLEILQQPESRIERRRASV